MSSVKKNKRGESNFAYFYDLYALNDELVHLIQTDFGIKDLDSSLAVFTKLNKMDKYSQNQLRNICTQYDIELINKKSYIVYYYKDWLMDNFRNLVTNVTMANSIYPNSEFEFKKKFDLIFASIRDCQLIFQVIQLFHRCLSFDEQKVMPLVALVEKEIKHLKNWKRATYKQYIDLYTKNGINTTTFMNVNNMNDYSVFEQSKLLNNIEQKNQSHSVEPEEVLIFF